MLSNLKKKLNKEDYLQPYHKSPKILSSILSTSCKGEAVLFSIDKLKIRLVANCKYENNKTVSEGDVINIRTETEQRVNISGPISYNVTILIELDPF